MILRLQAAFGGLVTGSAVTAVLLAFPLQARGEAQTVEPRVDATESLQTLLSCSRVADNDERLDCFDKAAEAVEKARMAGDLLVADRDELAAQRKADFGGASDRGPFPGAPEVNEVSFILQSVRKTSGGLFILVMEDGSVWQQTESAILRIPRPGAKVLVESGALGSFRASINGGKIFRVKRIR